MHYKDCPSRVSKREAQCNCHFRYEVVQVTLDGTEMPWGLHTKSDGGALSRGASLHPETRTVMVFDRVDGRVSREIRPVLSHGLSS